MQTTLFFDDEVLVARQNVLRRQGQAKPIEASIYSDPLANTAWGYPAVFRRGDGEWMLLYGANFDRKVYRGGGSVALAVGDDGIHWTPDDRVVGTTSSRRLASHHIAGPGQGGIFSSGFELPHPVAGLERYNFLYHHGSERPDFPSATGELWTSADGHQWRLAEGPGWQRPNPDPPTFVHWNALLQKYVLTTRPNFADRRIAQFTTNDFKQYTRVELAVQTDSLDRALTQIYGMPTFPYEGWYVALPWMFDVSATETVHLPQKYLGGKQYPQFAYSFDGRHWQRGQRSAFIANGEPGEPDAGCLQPSSMVQLPDGSLRFYASTSQHEHGHCPPGDGYIVAYGLRRDGFVYLESDGGKGVVATRPVYWRSGSLELNAQAPAGWVRVQISTAHGKPIEGFSFEDCDVLHADDVKWRPTWRGRGLDSIANTMVSIEIELENARLYALRGDYTESRHPDVIAFERDGTAPIKGRRPGQFQNSLA